MSFYIFIKIDKYYSAHKLKLCQHFLLTYWRKKAENLGLKLDAA